MDIKQVKLLEEKFKRGIISEKEYSNLLSIAFKGGKIGQEVYDEIRLREFRLVKNGTKV